MSTPAQLLAMKHAAESAATNDAPISTEEASLNSSPVNSIDTPALPSLAETVSLTPDSSASADSLAASEEALQSSTPTTVESIAEIPKKQTPKKSKKKKVFAMDDDKAFPTLGAALGESKTSSAWDNASSAIRSGVKSGSYAEAAASAAPSSFHPAVKSSNTQTTFIIDADQQVDVPKADIFKIFSRVKRVYGVSVESTLSTATNKRTFLLSGPASSIQVAKREVLKKLTKPVIVKFTIPSSVRSAVIGSQGSHLKPIINDTRTKIDIEREIAGEDAQEQTEDDEIFGKMLSVSIQGDIAGCEEAKARILSIVNENTKNLSVRINVDPDLKPFLPSAFKTLNLSDDLDVTYPDPETKSCNVLLSGPRDDVIDARAQIKDSLATLGANIVTEERTIPKRVHPLLDPKKIFDATNVLVALPADETDSELVSFTGLKQGIPAAITYAKELCANYFVDSLDLARSHGGDAPHAKCLTAYFIYTKYFDQLSTKYDVLIHAPSYASLAKDDVKTAIVTFTCHKEKKDILKKVRKEVVDSVNKITPNLVRVVTDIDLFIFGKLDDSTATENGVSIVPLGKLAGFGNKLILILQQSDDEFLPSGKEIQERLDAADSSLNTLRELSKEVMSKTISVDSKDQQHLEGKTLSVLLSKFEPGSVEIKLHQNADGPSPDEVFLHGMKSNIENAVSSIAQAIEDVKNYEEACKYNVTIDCPSKLLSRLIGRSGNHLNQLREQFDVKVDVLEDNKGQNSKEENSNSKEATPVRITGLKTNADEAVKHIQYLLKTWSDEKRVVLNIDHKFHSRLIGPGGAYVNKLQDRYKVIVRFPHDSEKGHENEVVIRGPSRGVTKAEGEMKELLEYERENGFSEVIKVPASCLSRIIGKNGEHIKDISAEAEVVINSKKNAHTEGDEEGEAEFEIRGSKSGIKKAKDTIQEFVSRMANQTSVTVKVNPKYFGYLIGPRGSTKRQIVLKAGGSDEDIYEFRKYMQVPNKDADSDEVVCSGDKTVVDKIVKEIKKLVGERERVTLESIPVPKKKRGLLVGPGGSARRALESEFKVIIRIPRADSDSEEITVSGLPENIKQAKEKIAKIIE